MSNGNQKRTRSERVAALELPPTRTARMLAALRRGDVLLRFAIGIACLVAIFTLTQSWRPPFRFRGGYVPTRDLVVRASFREFDLQATELARRRATDQVRYVYSQDPEPLVQLRSALVRRLVEVSSAASRAQLPAGAWEEFHPLPVAGERPLSEEEQEAELQRLRAALASEEAESTLEAALGTVLEPYERHGLLDKLPQELDRGNQQEILVYRRGQPEEPHLVKLTDVLVGEGSVLEERLTKALPSLELARWSYAWLRPRIVSTRTLALDESATRRAREQAAKRVPDEFRVFAPGQVIARAGEPLDSHVLDLLEHEHDAQVVQWGWRSWLGRSMATLGILFSLWALCGYYVVYRDSRPLASWGHYLSLWGMVVATVAIGRWVSTDAWRAELIPLLLLGMTLTIVYDQQMALMVSTATAVVMATTLGVGSEFSGLIVLAGVSSAAILLLARIRSRSKLVKVGVACGILAALLSLGVGALENQPLGWPLLASAGLAALWSLVAGLLMTSLVPAIERAFGVLTDFRLLELGDIGRPLLQELMRRAPGTYNHSINVASLADAAAESIGLNGLLVRVGAYYHDIGKMLKPGYFAENMSQQEASRHENLVPAMSTLIIIAHVKDGADLARQRGLHERLIDFIEQHHGTTVVEYFFHRASQQQGASADAPEVDEESFRYPGPKPQTKEAAVLMVADAVESAARTLVEPTPARIEGLVDELAMRRLLDGQFDDCSLTLQELRTVQDSLVKSLVAIYHGRVKYPTQRTA